MSSYKSFCFFLGFLCLQFLEMNSLPVNPCNEFGLEKKVEQLIEKIVVFMEGLHHVFDGDIKCIPEDLAGDLIDVVKESVECESENERLYFEGEKTLEEREDDFEKCFEEARIKIESVMASINETDGGCPDEISDKNYLINVTTTYIKTFYINIKNGLEDTKKEIELDKKTVYDVQELKNEDDSNPEEEVVTGNADPEETTELPDQTETGESDESTAETSFPIPVVITV